MVYNADPGTYVNSFNSAFGDSAVTGAIVAIPELSYLSFTSRAFTRTGIDIHVLLGGGTVLKYRNFSLAEHDIYGSSRLGIRSYYPKQIGLAYDDARKYYDTVRLWNPVPWYSLEYQDVVKTDSMNLYGNAHRDPFITQLVTGTKQYEITDHLGNVLTTLSDKRAANSYTAGSPASGTSIDTIATRKPVVVSAYDYYPFGEYMPGRFTEDSGSYCFTTTLTEMVTTMTMAPLQVHLYGRLSNGGASPVVTPSDNGGILVTSTEAGTGVSWPLNDGGSEPGTHGEITLVTAVSAGVFTASVVEDGTGSVRGSINLYSTQGVSTSVVLPYTHTGSSTGVSIHIVRADVGLGGDYSTHISTILVPTYTTTPQNVVSTVCNGENYRYGFNGQLKDNEWAGKGNHYQYGVREYDPRIARFNRVDPLTQKFPWYTPYQFAGNSPVANIDLDGLEEYYAANGSLIGKIGTSTEIRIVYDKSIALATNATSGALSGRAKAMSEAFLYNSGSAEAYTNEDAVANEWGQRYNGPSIAAKAEYKSYIYRTRIGSTKYYTNTEPEIGSGSSVTGGASPPPGFIVLADIHTHANYDPKLGLDNEVFSDGAAMGQNYDIQGNISLGINGYLATPSGTLQKFDVTTRQITTLSSNLPSDPKDPNRKIPITSSTPPGLPNATEIQ